MDLDKAPFHHVRRVILPVRAEYRTLVTAANEQPGCYGTRTLYADCDDPLVVELLPDSCKNPPVLVCRSSNKQANAVIRCNLYKYQQRRRSASVQHRQAACC
jgi:hypothetical protein